MNLQLDGRTAFVSGSTAGIGRAIAATLAREGARVIVNGRTQQAVDETLTGLRRELGAGVQVLGFAGDLSTEAAADDLARRHPDVNVLVNNYGLFEVQPLAASSFGS